MAKRLVASLGWHISDRDARAGAQLYLLHHLDEDTLTAGVPQYNGPSLAGSVKGSWGDANALER